MTLKQVIEALVFASPKPLLTKEIVAALRAAGEDTDDQEALDFARLKEPEVAAALQELQVEYVETGRAFRLAEQVNGWSLITDSSAARWVRQLYPEAKPTRLSGPALETLAIIAYRQPVTRADIEVVRGVAVDGVMQVLLERGLVKISGRAEVPGRPLLYSTTEYFLQHFGLKQVEELPNSDELRRVALPSAPIPTEEEAKPKGRKGKAAAAPPAGDTAAPGESHPPAEEAQSPSEPPTPEESAFSENAPDAETAVEEELAAPEPSPEEPAAEAPASPAPSPEASESDSPASE